MSMSIEASQDEQLLEDTLVRRPGSHLTTQEAIASAASVALLTVAMLALWVISPPYHVAIVPAVLCVLVLALSSRIRFYTPLGFTVPTQLAFVPLVFALPPAVVPIGVMIAFLLSTLPSVIGGSMPASRLLVPPSNAWFSVGPAAVLAIAHVRPEQAGPILLLAALAAQFVFDFGASAALIGVSREVGFIWQLRETWVYAVDAALTPPALLAAQSLHRSTWAAVAMVPLLGLLAVFALERQKRLQSTLELSSAYRGTALVLGDVVEADDGYTSEHCKSVVGLALEVAAQLRLDDERRSNLEFGALLHDVGKIAIPKEILNKPGKLDPDEWEIMKSHTIEGQKMLDQVGGFMREVGLIVRAHHERWDGGGYPDGLAGAQIPLEARIIACCDTWNAMRTDRPYRKALTHEVAAAELRSVSGTQLDPVIVDALLPIVIAADAEDRDPAAEAGLLSPDEAGAPPPLLAYGSARPAC
jgi:putative nucleotidyltransferase with HDIG domain